MFDFKVVKAKTKSIQSTPQITCTTSVNHFVLNSVAVDALDLEAGDHVMLIFNKTDNEDERFFITKAIDSDDSVAKCGATGSSLHFNYAGIYGSILLNDENRAMISLDELLDNGLLTKVKTAKGNEATRGRMKLTYTLETVGEHVLAEGEEARQLFALTNRTEAINTNLEGDDSQEEEAAE